MLFAFEYIEFIGFIQFIGYTKLEALERNLGGLSGGGKTIYNRIDIFFGKLHLDTRVCFIEEQSF